MENDAYAFKDKRSENERGTLLSAYLVLLGVVAAAALIILIMPTINLLVSIADDVSFLAGQGDTEGLAFIFARTAVLWLVQLVGLGIAWMLLALFGRAVRSAWGWRPSGYNMLMIFGGLAVLGGLVLEDWRIGIAGVVHVVILFFLAHIKFYPEYAGKTFGEYLRDLNFINIAWQSVFATLIIGALKVLWLSIYSTLLARNLLPTFTFLDRRAGFGINQSPEWYSSNSTYGMAFFVGVVNTLQVVSIGLVLATILGILLGIFLLSNNWLIKTISRVYVEILSNTPLLVQLLFWYFVVILQLLPEDDIILPNESMLIVPLRWIFYVLGFIGIWLFALRQPDTIPRRTVTGTFFGIIVLEIAFSVLGDSYGVIIAVALAGAALIAVSRQPDTLPEGLEGLPFGIGLLAVLQAGWHLLTSGLYSADMLNHPRVLYGEVFPVIFIARTGFVVPKMVLTVNFMIFGIAVAAGIIVAVALYIYWGRIIDRTGRAIPRLGYAIGIVLLSGIIGWVIASAQGSPEEVTVGEGDAAQVVTLEQAREEQLLEADALLRYESDPVVIQLPERNKFKRVMAGVEFDPSYMALLIGLVIYTSAFIGEIVRAGIQAVPFGQLEAARALGLSQVQTLRMIVLPQALRVIIPPMGNQYLNLSKNSSLATAIAFSDTYQVGQTIMNQSGQSITGFFLVLVVYLTMSLIISLFMNLVNSRFQLVTR